MIQKNNHTQLPNEIVDVYMKQLSDKAFKVITVICRKTIGWHKETDSISASQIVAISGLSRSSVLRAIVELEELNLVLVDRVGDGKTPNSYTINYTLSDTGVSVTQGGCQPETGGSVSVTHTKETLNKVKERVLPIFKEPTLEEVEALVREEGYTFKPKHFFDYYNSNDWRYKDGKKMKNLKQAMVTWQNKQFNTPTSPTNAFKEMPVAK